MATDAHVTDAAQLEAAVGVALDRFGRIDVLVSNAGRGTVCRPQAHRRGPGRIELHCRGTRPDETTRATRHRTFLDGLVEAALADGQVSDDEIDQSCRAAALLELDRDVVTLHTDPYRTVNDTVTLTPGLCVCFTDSATDGSGNEIDQAVLESLAIRNGLVARDSVTAKECGLLVAADASTRPGKADQARRFGIPVASLDDFLQSINTSEPLPVIRLEHTGVALVCVSCGHSWIAKRRSREPRCVTCK